MDSHAPISSRDDSAPPGEWNALEGVRVVQGRVVVLTIVAFALLMTGAMFVYWELYTRPFRPLQAAIAAKYEESSPRAVGGRYKSHLAASLNRLRLIVRISWDPREDETRARSMANDLVEIARDHVPLETYDRVEIYLMHRRPERLTITWSVDAPRGDFPLTDSGELPEEVIRRVSEGIEGT